MKHLTEQGRIYFWLNFRGIGSCGGLNENNYQRHKYLNTWSPVGSTVLGRFRRCGHAGESVLLGVDFEVSKPCSFLSSLSVSYL